MENSRLGIITDEVSDDLQEALRFASDKALSHVEIRTVNGKNAIGFSDATLRDIRREVEAEGLFISCFASPIFKCALSASREVSTGDLFGGLAGDVERHLEKLRRAIEIAQILGTKNIRIFSFWRETEPTRYMSQIADHLSRAAEIAAGMSALLLLENEPSCNGGYANEVAALTRQVNSPSLRVLWDPGNEAYGGQTAFPAGYDAVRGLVAHVHLKDVLVSPQNERTCVPIGSGEVPFFDQCRELWQDGYTGLYTIEPHYVPEGGTRQQGAGLSLIGMRAVMERLRASGVAGPAPAHD